MWQRKGLGMRNVNVKVPCECARQVKGFRFQSRWLTRACRKEEGQAKVPYLNWVSQGGGPENATKTPPGQR